MKRILFILLIIVNCQLSIVNSAHGQTHIGYLSYDSVMHQMPEYAQARQSVAELRAKYEQEATRGEEEFQRKFSEFLQGQKDFPENILVKRQAELQALMETGIKFRQEAQQLLEKAERELIAGVESRLNDAIRVVGVESGYVAILNTDRNQCPFINPVMGEDVTREVLRKLGIVVKESVNGEQ